MLAEACRLGGLNGVHAKSAEEEITPVDDGELDDLEVPDVPVQAPGARVPIQVGAPEKTHPGESQSNGKAERGVRIVEEQVRTLKAALEARISTKIPSTHPIIEWLRALAAQVNAR